MIATRLALAGLCLGAGSSIALLPAAAQTKAAAVAAPVAVEEPRDIVAALYKRAALDVKKDKVSSFDNRDTRAKYFSKSFDLLVTSAETKAAHDGTSTLDFDPISASQDAELQKVTLKTDVLELGKAVVSASFSNHGQPTVVTYDFVKDEGAWKINDIKGTTEKEAWSVRKILTASGKPPQKLPGEKKDAIDEKATAK